MAEAERVLFVDVSRERGIMVSYDTGESWKK